MPRLRCFLLALILFLVSIPILGWAASIPLQNITIVAPVGTTQYGDDHLLCVPTRFLDILAFFGANYVAHVATVRLYPGESQLEYTFGMVTALLLPMSGIVRGITVILRRGSLGGSDLETAARSGALCMLVRTKGWKPLPGTRLSQVAIMSTETPESGRRNWVRHPNLNGEASPYLAFFWDPFPKAVAARPLSATNRSVPTRLQRLAIRLKWYQHQPETSDDTLPLVPLHTAVFSGENEAAVTATYRTYVPRWLKDIFHGFFLPDTVEIVTGSRKIHKNPSPPEGYAFAFVPRAAKVVPLDDGDRPTIPPPQRGWLKGIVSLAQALYAGYTLYEARGDQISRYGYAAFGLTVLPYAVMSTINLLGALCTPEYDELYLVESDTLLEARAIPGASFEGVVGRLLPVNTDPPDVPHLGENTLSAIVETRVGVEDPSPVHIDISGHHFEVLPDDPLHEGIVIEIPVCGEFQRRADPNKLSPSLWMLVQDDHIYSSIVYTSGVLFTLNMLVNLLIYGIIFGVTSPHGGGTDSTQSQRVWVIMWLVIGTLYGYWGICILPLLSAGTSNQRIAQRIFGLTLIGVPSIGVFWGVVQMLLNYGTCTRYD